jgi:hypothetical protein
MHYRIQRRALAARPPGRSRRAQTKDSYQCHASGVRYHPSDTLRITGRLNIRDVP